MALVAEFSARPGADPGARPERPAVLVTRPEPGLSETMTRVAVLGWRPVASPAIVIDRRPFSMPAPPFDAVLVTSGQAIGSLQGAVAPDAPLIAVGEATATRAREAGFGDVRAAGGDAASLAALLGRRSGGHGRLLLPTGAGMGLPLAATLRQAGWSVARRVVYEARPVRSLSSEALRAIDDASVRAVLFFSAETARAFRACVPEGILPRLREIQAIALAPKVAAALVASEWASISVAARPHQEAILSCLQHLTVGSGADRNAVD